LEIDLAAIEKLAAEADMLAQREELDKAAKRTKRATKDKTNAEVSPGGEVAPGPVLVHDPEFEFMITHCVMGGVEKVKVRLKWDDPGLQWKEKVGGCIYRLLQRIAPIEPGPIADALTLTGYLTIWGASNVLFREPSPDTDTVGDNGQRKNMENV